jgi:hypothetical protein
VHDQAPLFQSVSEPLSSEAASSVVAAEMLDCSDNSEFRNVLIYTEFQKFLL